MYERFYGLSERPFELTADPKYLFLTTETARGAQQSAVRASVGAIAHGADRRGRNRQDDAHPRGPRIREVPPRPMHLPEQSCAPHRRLHPAARPQVRTRSRSQASPRRCSSSVSSGSFENGTRAGETTALVIDEAQSLSVELLEEVRLLANIETPLDEAAAAGAGRTARSSEHDSKSRIFGN